MAISYRNRRHPGRKLKTSSPGMICFNLSYMGSNPSASTYTSTHLQTIDGKATAIAYKNSLPRLHPSPFSSHFLMTFPEKSPYLNVTSIAQLRI